jgi:hypothetical protein
MKRRTKPLIESETAMRFLVMVKGNKDYEAGAMPSKQELTDMGKFNDELVQAGVMLAGEGLQPSSKGARISFAGAKRTVRDGPFTEAKELVAGFWIWQVKSRAEALEWAKRIPFNEGDVEIRQIFEAEDFGAEFTPELRKQEEQQRAAIAKNKQRAGQ